MSKTEKEKHEKIARLRKMRKQFEKEKDVRGVIRVKALIAYYNGMLSSVIVQCYEINEKTLKNWIQRFENEEALDDLPRSGRPSKLPKDKEEELREMIAQQNQRVWVARHICEWLSTRVVQFYQIVTLLRSSNDNWSHPNYYSEAAACYTICYSR